jgi:hypothetical protein
MTPPKADPMAERLHKDSDLNINACRQLADIARAYFRERLGRERVATALLHFDQTRSHIRLSKLDEVQGEQAYLSRADAILALLEPNATEKS